MKNILLVITFLIFSGCGPQSGIFTYDGSTLCTGGANLISTVTPTRVSLASSGTTTIPLISIGIQNVNCETVSYSIVSTGTNTITESIGPMSTYPYSDITFLISNIPIMNTQITGTTGVFTVKAQTNTRSSNTSTITWTKP